MQLRHLRAAAIGDLHPDKTVPDPDRDRDRPARSPDRLCRTPIAEQLAHQQDGVIPARVTGTEHPADERAGDPCPLRPARPPSRSPGSPAQPSAHPPSPAAPAPGKSPGPPGRMYGNARSTQRLTSSRNARPARPVRGKPTVHTDRPSGWTPFAICPWAPRHRDLQCYKVTHDGTHNKRPA